MTPPASSYVPRLDGLRAVAIAGVFIEHYTFNEVVKGFRPGQIGVHLFFVLSGFLITAILLAERDAGAKLAPAARRFYWRRVLRLYPALLVAIAGAAILGVNHMRQEWWLHLLYLSNFVVMVSRDWSGAGHFWTLAVEEQFYLLWFLAVMAAPRRWLVGIIWGSLLLAPLYRAALNPDNAGFTVLMLPGQIDSLALGALLACARLDARLQRVETFFLSRTVLAAATVATFILALPLAWAPFPKWVLFPIATNMLAACLVSTAVRAGAGDRSWLSWAPVRHVGRISYGLYVYHYFVPFILGQFHAAGEGASGLGDKLARIGVWALTTLAVAELSYWCLERPALAMKRGGLRSSALPAAPLRHPWPRGRPAAVARRGAPPPSPTSPFESEGALLRKP